MHVQYLALVNAVPLSCDSRYGRRLEHSAFTDQTLGAVQGEVGTTSGADGHLKRRFGGGLGQGRES